MAIVFRDGELALILSLDRIFYDFLRICRLTSLRFRRSFYADYWKLDQFVGAKSGVLGV